MGRLIPVNEIDEEFADYPFLDAPEGYWNVSKDGYNGYEQVRIDSMDEAHKKRCIAMIHRDYLPRYQNNQDVLELFEQKLSELGDF